MYESLQLAERMIQDGHPPATDVIAAVHRHLARRAPAGRIDYVQIVSPETLEDMAATDAPVLAALAVTFGRARLIDNIVVG